MNQEIAISFDTLKEMTVGEVLELTKEIRK